MTKSERFGKAVNYLRMQGMVAKNEDVAIKMGADPSNVSRSVKGTGGYPSDSFLRRFNTAFDNIFNSKWLLNGEGDMFNKDINISQTIDTNTGVITNNIGGEDSSRSTTNTTNNTTNNYAECEKANTSSKLLGMAIEEISEQRKLVSKAQEQIDRLITLLEKK